LTNVSYVYRFENILPIFGGIGVLHLGQLVFV